MGNDKRIRLIKVKCPTCKLSLLIRDYHGSEKILGGGQAKEYSRVRFPIQGTFTGGRDLTQSIIIGL